MKSPHLIHAGLLLALLALPLFIRELQPWPLYLLAPLTIYAVIVAVTPPLRRSVHWLHFGRLDGVVVAWTAAIILGSSAALMLWFVLARPEVGDLRDKIPHVEAMQLVLIGMIFSLGNALMEEVIFRGVFQETLTVDWGPWPAIAVQGVMFAAIHAQGFPHGAEGMVMATVYGVALGWLRLRSGGMAASCIAHVCADATIFALLALPAGAFQ